MSKWLGKQLLQRVRQLDLMRIHVHNADWIKMAQDHVHWQAFMLLELDFCVLLPFVVVAVVTAAANNFLSCNYMHIKLDEK